MIRIVQGSGAGSLLGISRDEIIAAFKSSGALLFRGFSVVDDELKAFSESYGSRFATNLHAGAHRDMVSDEGRTSTVNLGNNLVGHHSELSYSPLRPHLLWLHCIAPALKGGETLVCDGIELWSKLPLELQRRFSDSWIKYLFPRSDQSLWPLFTGAALDVANTIKTLERLPQTRFQVNADGTLDIEYLTPAVLPARWQNAPAFVNSIIVHSDGLVRFEDGTPITKDLQWELLAEAQKLTTSVKWQAGDLLMIDNTRMMHGRMPFADPGRRIHVRMSDASF